MLVKPKKLVERRPMSGSTTKRLIIRATSNIRSENNEIEVPMTPFVTDEIPEEIA